MITCTKKYSEFPFAHRQHNHDGHCRLIHGHNFDFEFTFGCEQLDENGFVIDFGKLKHLKEWLTKHFDHTLVLNERDPMLPHLQEALSDCSSTRIRPDLELSKIVVVPNCGAEGLAQWLLMEANRNFFGHAQRLYAARHVEVVKVTVYEDSRNSATFSIQT
jgi:6-pyruvoyltetrahydropterin/6-carboxytetrahydropterin synthase